MEQPLLILLLVIVFGAVVGAVFMIIRDKRYKRIVDEENVEREAFMMLNAMKRSESNEK